MVPKVGHSNSWIARAWNAALTAVSHVGGALMSTRALIVWALIGCSILAIGPWLRPAISRDFRAIHIPWTANSPEGFVPEFVAEVPRPWRPDSVATPILAVTAIGILVSMLRPDWSNVVFGILLALSLPAVAATFWNHPSLVEFMEGEIRERGMLRVVYRQRTDDAMTNLAPDRLRILGEKYSRETIEAPNHPVVAPFRFSMYGPWLIAATAIGTIVTSNGSWPRRFAYGCVWGGVGILLAGIVTSSRWQAEYHLARAESAENSGRYDAAQQSLQLAFQDMPQLAHTARGWQAKGRLTYRLHEPNTYTTYFLANQYLANGELSRARAEIEHSIRGDGGTAVQRSLLAEIVGQIGTQYGLQGDYGAAELAWGEAAAIVPWKPAYWIGRSVTILAGNPQRAAEIKEATLEKLKGVGDCFVSSDLASMLGDAYFASGEFHEARDMYTTAMDLFHLPKYVNLHAQEGRLGM